MKKLWLHNLALSMGIMGAGSAVAQYPNGYNNVGPSSYPVQTQAGNPQSVLQNLPQVPQQYNHQGNQSYQLVGMQEQVGAFNVAPSLPTPQNAPQPNYAPQAYAPQAASPATSQGQAYPQSAPAMNYGYAQNVAPGCSTCGPNPVSQPCQYDGYNSCAAPSAFNAPGFFSGGFGGDHGHGGRLAGIGGLPDGAKAWFFGGSYLNLRRVDDHNRPLSLYDANLVDVLGTGSAQMNSMNGFQVMGGRYFNCGKNAIAASYWGVFSDTESASIVGAAPGAFRSRVLSLGDVMMPVDQTGAANNYDAYTWYDNAYEHRVTRSSEYHNVEVNLLGFAVGCASRNFNRPTSGTMFSGSRHNGCGYCGGAGCGSCSGEAASRYATGPTGYVGPACGSRLNLSWLAGLRYFRFEDNLQYAASFNNNGITRAVDDIYYDVNTTNDLVGFQVGGRSDYCIGKRVNLYNTAKVGLYNNRANLYSRLGTDTAVGYDVSYPTTNYLVDETDNRVAFLSELGSGVGVRVSPKWTATFGYQAIIASGVATSVGNVRSPRDFVRDQRYIDNTDTLILHGFNIGALYNF